MPDALFLLGLATLSHRRTEASFRHERYFAIYLAYPRMRLMFVIGLSELSHSDQILQLCGAKAA
jgi:hypothetical protein